METRVFTGAPERGHVLHAVWALCLIQWASKPI